MAINLHHLFLGGVGAGYKIDWFFGRISMSFLILFTLNLAAQSIKIVKLLFYSFKIELKE